MVQATRRRHPGRVSNELLLIRAPADDTPPPQPESDAPDRDPPQPAATGALFRALVEAGAARDRKLDVLAAQMRLVIGGFGLLVTALIAVFSILFAR